MSFQNFRLHTIPQAAPQSTVTSLAHAVSPSSLSQALGQSQNPPRPPLPPQAQNDDATAQRMQNGGKKAPYGSGDIDDGYTLVFENMDAFQAWRMKEEEEKMVEFVKGDTHGSKAVPPRFKDHTKLVCARHTRSGRKKYVKKYPDRVRKVPSRKLEGMGCPASISYKTYFDTDEVRACYIADHSHEIGLANLPFTRRGRKSAAEAQARNRARTRGTTDGDQDEPDDDDISPPPTPPPAVPSAQDPQIAHIPPQTFQSAIMAIAPQQQQQQQAPPQPIPQQQQAHMDMNQERWERMNVLFQGIRNNARNFEFPGPSVAALESVLIRLYLESPMGGGGLNGG